MCITVSLAGCNSTAAPSAVDAPAETTPSTSAPSTAATTHASARPKATATHRPAGVALPHGEVLLAGGTVVLPNRARTPGAANPAVTPATIRSTICLTGYTKTIRPSSSYTTGLKRQQLASGYSYRGIRAVSAYEEDHLIPLELGGSPASERNLWPEPYVATQGARVKDKIENKLHDLVCSGQLSLRVAQQAIAANWWTALQRYGGASASRSYSGTYVGTTGTTSGSTSRAPSSTSGSTNASGATAQCRDGSYSYSRHRSGTCSRHGGVARWINRPPS